MNEDLIRLVRSFLWCLVHQSEKVPGHVRHMISLLEPDLTEEQQDNVSQQIINKIKGERR
jgi:hypothetical protein